MTAFRLLRNVSLTTIALLIIMPAHAADAPIDATRMEQIVASYVSRNDFIGSVLVARGDEILFEKSYGMANMDWNIPNTPDTRFRIGSITKQFTAASILLLEERGMLSVNDKVSQHMSDAPEAWKDVTIHHLLTHTAGVPTYTAMQEFGTVMRQVTTPQQLVAMFRDKPLDFAPGEKFSYSNSGYVLLGYLIEEISGQDYATFVQQNLFKPLQMQETGYDSTLAIIPKRATGYSHVGPTFSVSTYVDMTTPYSAGALYSTTHDLLRWEQALFGGKVLKPESLAKMTTPALQNYAYGLTVTGDGDAKNIAHGGAINGFNTALAYYPASQTTVIALANVQGNAPDRIVAQLGQLAQGKAVTLSSERQEITLPNATLARYVGVYEMTPQMKMSITLENNQLVSQLVGQGKVPIFAESETSFFPKVVEAQLVFKLDDSGKPTAIVLNQNGRSIEGKRISDTVAVRAEVTLPADKLAEYPGTYAGTPLNFTVTLVGTQLKVQASGQPALDVFAEAEDKFFLKVVDAQIEFVREGGKIVALILHQGPANLRAERQ